MNWRDFEKTWHQSKKFLACLVMEVLLGGLTFYMMFRAASEVVSWQTTSVLFVLIFNMGFIAVAFNVGQAKLDTYLRLTSILGKIPKAFARELEEKEP
jgi:uncharacterized membrane protein